MILVGGEVLVMLILAALVLLVVIGSVTVRELAISILVGILLILLMRSCR